MSGDPYVCKQVPQEELTLQRHVRRETRQVIIDWLDERLRNYLELPSLGSTSQEMYLAHTGRVEELREILAYLGGTPR